MSSEIYRQVEELARRNKKRPFSAAGYGAAIAGAAGIVLGAGVSAVGMSNSEAVMPPSEGASYQAEALVGFDALDAEVLMPEGWQFEEGQLYVPGDWKQEAAQVSDLVTLVSEDGSHILEVARGEAAEKLSMADYEVCVDGDVRLEEIAHHDMVRTDLACLGGYAVTLWEGSVDGQEVTLRLGKEDGSDEVYGNNMEASLAAIAQ